LPVGLFAAFPGWLNSLPQSGGWLNSVKVTLGFIELALAFKFLSNADLVLQAHWLERELFLAIWIAIFGLMALYLLGKLKFSHDSDTAYLSVTRLTFSIVTLIFVIYLLPGLWGAPLKLISGFPPPLHYSESPYGVGGFAPEEGEMPEGSEVGPHKLIVFEDNEHGMNYAKEEEVDLPLMMDFTGYACVNCRKMEENVWSDPAVMAYLRDSVVIASLHVDDKAALPADEVRMYKEEGKNIKTVGNKWSDFQRENYHQNSQPQYILMDHEGNMLVEDASYKNHGNVDDESGQSE